MLKPTPQKRELLANTLKRDALRVFAVMAVLLFAMLGASVIRPANTFAVTTPADTLNFQARLENSDGSIAPDGIYNVEFKLYNAGAGGTALWTETHTVSGGNGVRVQNGYLTVNLGDATTGNPFTGAVPAIDWSQQLYLTMNVGGTDPTTPSWDGEMSPRLALTAVPYAFSAQNLKYTDGTNTNSLTWDTQSGNNSILLPSASGTVCLQSSTSCGFESTTGTDFIQNGPAVQQTASFNIVSPAAGTIAAQIQGTTSATQPVLLVKGGATPGAGGDLLQLQDSNANVVASFNASGMLKIANQNAGCGYTTISPAAIETCTGGGNVQTLLSSNSNDQFTIGSGGSNFYGIRINGVSDSYNGGRANLVIRQASGATNDAFVIQDGSSANVLSKFDASGNLQVASSIDTSSTGALNVGLLSGGNATAINLNQNTTVASGKTLSVGNSLTYTTYDPGSSFTGPTVATGSSPYSVATGDFNGDGKPDLAVVNQSGNTVSVLLGNGDGTFQTKVDYATGTSPQGVTTGDFNGDGKPDLAVTNFSSNTVSVLLGNGNGTFQAKVDYATGTNPQAVTTGDFNGDGKADLAVVNYNSNTVSIFLGNGNGTFQAKVDYSTSLNPRFITTGDFNGDGKTDLAVSNQASNTVSIFLGNGNGTFQAKVDYPTGTGPEGVTTGDFNGDGKPDLAVVNHNSNTVSVLLGNGNGTFQAKVDYATGTTSFGVTTGDFNGDGIPDLATANFSSNTVSVLLGNGDGTFQAKVDYPTGSGPFAITTGDFNGDGIPDLAVTNLNANTISVLLNGFTANTHSTTMSLTTLNGSTGGLFIQGSSSQTEDLLRLQNPSANALFTIDGLGSLQASGTALFKNTTDSTTAFQVQNTGGTTLLNVDTSANKLQIATTEGVTTGSVTTNVHQLALYTGGSYISSSMQLGSDNLPRYSYIDNGGSIQYVQCTNADCSISNAHTIATAANQAMVLGTDDMPRIVYIDSSGNLKFVRCTAQDCSTMAPIVTIASDADPSAGPSWTAPSLILDSSNNPFITYDRASDDHLVVVACNAVDCSSKTVTAAGPGTNTYYNTSLAIGSDGFLRIATYNDSDSSLFIQCTNLSCSTSASNYVSHFYSNEKVFFGSDGMPRILGGGEDSSYNEGLYLAVCSTASCSSYTLHPVEAGGTTHFYSDSPIGYALGSDGFLRIVYAQATGSNNKAVYELRYAICTSDTCDAATSYPLDETFNTDSLFATNAMDLRLTTTGTPYAFYNNGLGGYRLVNLSSASGGTVTAGIDLGTPSNPFQNINAIDLNLQGGVSITTNDLTRSAIQIDGSGSYISAGNNLQVSNENLLYRNDIGSQLTVDGTGISLSSPSYYNGSSLKVIDSGVYVGQGDHLYVDNIDSTYPTLTLKVGTASGAVTISQSGKTTTVAGNLSVTGTSTFNGNVTVNSGKTLTAKGSVLFQNSSNSTTAFQVKRSGTGGTVLTVDTTNSQVTIQGTNSSATLGTELANNNFTTSNWTNYTTGWTLNASSADHNVGSTGRLSFGTGSCNGSTIYQLTYTVTNYLAGSIFTTAGGGTGPTVTANGTYTAIIDARSSCANPVLQFWPTADFAGTISGVSLKAYTASNAQLILNDSTGTAELEVRSAGGNIGLGLDAATYMTSSAGNNVAIGESALQADISGSANTALGNWALENLKTGSSNVAIGLQAGDSLQMGSGNVFLGYQAGYNETGSNKLYIANSNTSTPLIYGDFGTSALTVNGSQTVSNVTAGNTVMTLQGASAQSGSFLKLLAEGGSTVANFDNNGNLTLSPQAMADAISGVGANATDVLTVIGAPGQSTADSKAAAGNGANITLEAGAGGTNTGGGSYGNGGDITIQGGLAGGDGAIGLVQLQNQGGNVHIGTGAATTSYILSVTNSDTNRGLLQLNDATTSSTVLTVQRDGGFNLTQSGFSTTTTGNGMSPLSGNFFVLQGAAGQTTTGTTGQVGGNGAAVYITSGAGGDAPAGSTNGNGGDITLQGGAAGSGAGLGGYVGRISLQPAGGDVGIGTSAPATKLEVSDANNPTVRLTSQDTSLANGSPVGTLGFYSSDTSTNATGQKAYLTAVCDDAPCQSVGLALGTSNSTSSSGVEQLRISGSGNVGIGTSSPGAKLDVQSATTTGTGLNVTANSLTTGSAVNISSSASNRTSGNLVNINEADTYTSNSSVSASTLNVARNLTTNVASAEGTVAFDSSASGVDSTATTTMTWSHTVGGGSNRLLVVGVSVYNNAVSSVTYGGQTMTQVDAVFPGGTVGNTYIFKLVNPPSGTANIVVTLAGATTAVGSSASYSNVNQSTPIAAFAHNSGTSGAASVSVTSTVAEKIFDIASLNTSTTATAGGGQTVIESQGLGPLTSSSSTKTAAAGTTTMTWTYGASSNTWGQVAVAVKGANSGSVLTVTGALAGLTSNCTLVSGGCTDSSSILSLNQQFSGATGAVVKIQNSGTGDMMDLLNGSGNVVTKFNSNGDLQIGSNSSSNSSTALLVQNSSGQALLTADTSTMKVTVTTLVVSTTLTINGHIVTGGSAPTIAAGAAACTSPTVSVTGDDTAGVITVTTGTSCTSTGKLATVTFSSAFGAAPRVTLTPANGTGAALQYYYDAGTATATAFDLDTGTTPANTTTYKYSYHVEQ